MKLVRMLEDLTFDEVGLYAQNINTDQVGKIIRYMLKEGQTLEERRPPYVPVYYVVLQGTAHVSKESTGEQTDCGPGTLISFAEKEGYCIQAVKGDLVLVGFLHWAASA
jgi:quercetin dioxygenase-like cupin family protein